jgi:hypothetical protein
MALCVRFTTVALCPILFATLFSNVSNADDYIHLKAQKHEKSSETNVEYTLVPVISLAFANRNGFIFQRKIDKNGNRLERVMGQYSLRKEKESNGDQVLRVFINDKETEYGVLLPADDEKLSKVLVYTANRHIGGKQIPCTIVFKKETPSRSDETFLATFLAGIEKPDRDATKQMMKIWFD